MVPLDTRTPGSSREIYSEDASDGTIRQQIFFGMDAITGNYWTRCSQVQYAGLFD